MNKNILPHEFCSEAEIKLGLYIEENNRCVLDIKTTLSTILDNPKNYCNNTLLLCGLLSMNGFAYQGILYNANYDRKEKLFIISDHNKNKVGELKSGKCYNSDVGFKVEIAGGCEACFYPLHVTNGGFQNANYLLFASFVIAGLGCYLYYSINSQQQKLNSLTQEVDELKSLYSNIIRATSGQYFYNPLQVAYWFLADPNSNADVINWHDENISADNSDGDSDNDSVLSLGSYLDESLEILWDK
jgi:hypothetical protein